MDTGREFKANMTARIQYYSDPKSPKDPGELLSNFNYAFPNGTTPREVVDWLLFLEKKPAVEKLDVPVDESDEKFVVNYRAEKFVTYEVP